MKGFPDIPPIWWAGSVAVIYAAHWALPTLHVSSAALDWASRACLWIALAGIAWSALWFWRKRTPIEPHHTPQALIVEGPYKVSRNPIYLALVLLTLSVALGKGSVIGLGVTVALWWVLDRRFARVEEELLRRTFPDTAEEYIARTRRWL
ncbi:Putative protein-S-isoprenylcysteine methyltransferase [Tritonibacter multivorans]|uniref:Isoprenylcysteine carboxyl methyltransferase (ICMT) family protein n=1 Tax=Tritonibacter multivorans TaxID=928856 RepID=A0A0P1GIS9_9RHOB|nr:Putative protein-S-isoprenylcysteine methyltransferase [Tritonibacter multivorans]SFC92377.1 Protein-S-isoprenylcysteine O-methyltransferase Ste14 [Tritonibacter multivorans]